MGDQIAALLQDIPEEPGPELCEEMMNLALGVQHAFANFVTYWEGGHLERWRKREARQHTQGVCDIPNGCQYEPFPDAGTTGHL